MKRAEYIILILVWLLIIQGSQHLVAQQKNPSYKGILYLKEIDIQGTNRNSFKKYDPWIKVWENRVWNAGSISRISEDLLKYLRRQGYYFSTVDSLSPAIDSIRNEVRLRIVVNTGKPLYLKKINWISSRSVSPADSVFLKERLKQFEDQIYTPQLLPHLFDQILNHYENQGFPLARIGVKDFDLQPDSMRWHLNLVLKLDPGDTIRIAYIQFDPSKFNGNRYLLRKMRFRPNQLYQQHLIDKYRKILSREDFLKEIGKPQLMLDASNSYYIYLPLKEAPATTLDGIVGYIPGNSVGQNQKGYFTGLINIGIRNLFGTGRRLAIFWQKPDRFSEEFTLSYKEPFVLGLPFHTTVGMNRLVRDTTYIEWKYNLMLELPLSENLKGVWRITSKEVAPDSLASRIQRLPQTTSLFTETGIEWDSRNNPVNPSSGWMLNLFWTFGRQKNTGPRYLIQQDSLVRSHTLQKFVVDLEFLKSFYKNQVIANHLHGAIISSNGGQLNLPDLFWFGGATTVRGYREAQFFAEKVAWLNTEYRFLLGPQSRFYVFSDNAYMERKIPNFKKQFLHSFGLGIRIPAPLGLLEVSIGFEKGAPLREAKLHFRLINEF